MINPIRESRRRIWQGALAVTRWIGSPASLIFHTVVFIGSFLSVHFDFIQFDEMLLVLTTVVSLEAICLSIFIQMSLNYTTQELVDVGEDIEELQEDVGEIQEDMSEIQEDVGELQENVEEISEEVEETTEEEKAEEARKQEQRKTLTDIQADLRKLMQDISRLQKSQPPPSPIP